MDAASPEPLSPSKRKRRTKPTKCERYQDQILKSLDAGHSQRQVAAKLGISHSSISEWLDTLDQEKQQISRYRANRADALSQIQGKALTLQAKILDGLLKDGLPIDANLSQKSTLMQSLNIIAGTAFDKERLETGKSSSNIALLQEMVNGQVTSLYIREQKEKRKAKQPAPSGEYVNEVGETPRPTV